MVIKIGYGAGHGLSTHGKRSPDNENEWTFNNKILDAFENELKNYEGIALKRFDDRTGKVDVPLKTRTDGANTWGADYYISIHHNALAGKWGTHGGVETFYAKGSSKGLALANAIHPALVKAYGLRDRGIKTNNLHITRETKMPAILIEGGFMDSTVDIKALRNDEVLNRVGIAIAQALAAHLKLKKKNSTKNNTINSTINNTNNSTKVKGEMNMLMHEVPGMSKHYVNNIAAVYKKAYESGVLTSDEWYKKAEKYEITLGEVSYLSTILVSRLVK